MVQEKVAQIKEELISKGLKGKYNHPGVYCVLLEGHIVYVGKSRDMLERLAQHIYCIESDDKSNKYRVLHSAYEGGFNITFDVIYVSKKKRQAAIDRDIGFEEGRQIRELRPILNYQIPKEEDYCRNTSNKRAKTITLKEILAGEYKF